MSSSSDYASFNLGNNKYYFGYEILKNEEWAFAVNDKPIYSLSELEDIAKEMNFHFSDSSLEYLLIGYLYYENNR